MKYEIYDISILFFCNIRLSSVNWYVTCFIPNSRIDSHSEYAICCYNTYNLICKYKQFAYLHLFAECKHSNNSKMKNDNPIYMTTKLNTKLWVCQNEKSFEGSKAWNRMQNQKLIIVW